ncbi:MAG: DUF3352 domain-containing protein [Anaerolineae bacterium]
MKRLTLFVVLCFTLALAFPASADPTVGEVTALSQYYPDTTPMFISFRIDDEFLSTWSTLIDQLSQQYDLGFNSTLLEELDRLSSDIPGIGGTFQEVFGSWMGNTAAVGLLSIAELYDAKPENDSTIPWLISIEVEDASTALSFWQTILGAQDYTMSQVDGGTVFSPPPSQYGYSDPHVLLTNNTLFIAGVESALPLTAPQTSLNDSALFQSSLVNLPLQTYNAVLFAQTEPLFSALVTSPQFGMNAPGMIEYFSLFSAAMPSEAIGFTMLDDSSLVMDVAVPYTADSFISQQADLGLIDPDFLHYLPSGTPAVYHGTNLRDMLSMAGENLRASLEMQNALATPSPYSQSPADQFEGSMAQFSTLFRGATGLDPEEDLFRWMDGDFALALDVSEGFQNATTNRELNAQFPLEFGLVIDASTDPDAAAHAVQQIGNAVRVLTQNTAGVNVSSDEIGGSTVWALNVFTPDFDAPLELLIGSDEHVFVIGTRHFVQAALAPDGSLNDDEAYTAAQQYTLADRSGEAYFFTDEVASGLDFALNELSSSDEQTVRLLLALFGQSSLTQRYAENVGQARGVLTLRLGQ